MDRYIKSVAWLISGSAVGYGLLCLMPDQNFDKTKNIYPGVEKSPVENRKQKEKFVNILQATANTEQPIYRLSKEEIESVCKKK